MELLVEVKPKIYYNEMSDRSAFRFRLVITDYVLHQTLMTLFILLDIKFGDDLIYNTVSSDWKSLYRDVF